MEQTPRTKPNLIQRLAAEWIQEIGLQGFVGHAEWIFEHPGVIIRINRLRPATLGVIAWYGRERSQNWEKTSLYQVHCGTYLGKYDSGKEILRSLARTAMAAEIFDQLGQPDPFRQKKQPAPAWTEDTDGMNSYENMPSRLDHIPPR